MIGSRLSRLLIEKQYKVQHLSRSASVTSKYGRIYWNPGKKELDSGVLAGRKAIINLAGEGIAEKRWSSARKKEILESRILSSELLFSRLSQIKKEHLPEVFCSVSAVGFYGNRNDEELSETSSRGSGFLSETVFRWEESLKKIESLGIRTVILRSGVVLTKKGGALEKMALPVKFGMGSILGSGRQYISWIHIEDLCRLFLEAVENQNFTGILNAVSPDPVTNKEFLQTIASVLGRPFFLPPVPEAVLKTLLGEMSEIVLDGQRVYPKKAGELGFQFQYPKLNAALRNLFEKK